MGVVDLYGYVEQFCQQGTPNGKGGGPLLPPSSGFGGNYTACAIQSNGLHFFTKAPQPSGQQYVHYRTLAKSLPCECATFFDCARVLRHHAHDPRDWWGAGLLQGNTIKVDAGQARTAGFCRY